MRVFVTGATGFIGSAVVRRLLARGHRVTGLARSSSSAAALTDLGVEVARGDLADAAMVGRLAAAHDATVHSGFNHDDWTALEAAFRQDEVTVNAVLDALAGSGRAFVYTSGSGVLDDTGTVPVDESAPVSDAPALAARIRVERAVVGSAARGVRGVVVRAGLVYGDGGGGTMGLLLDLARREGGPFTVGKGWNVWSAVHRDDLADLYVRALESAPAGSLFQAANGERTTMREIAAAAGRAAGRFGPVRVLAVEEAREVAGDLADGLVAEKRIDADHARTVLGWVPTGPSIVEDVERGSYAGPPPAMDDGLTLINAFVVPGAAADTFYAEWLTDLAFMRRQPGFVSGTLYRADDDSARHRFVNVAHWRRPDDFRNAQAGMATRFRVEEIDRVAGWRRAGIEMVPATYRVATRFWPSAQ